MRYNAYNLTLHDNNVTQFTVKIFQLHKRNNWLSNLMTYLLIITLALSPKPSQTLFDKILLGVDAVLRHDQDICMTVHT